MRFVIFVIDGGSNTATSGEGAAIDAFNERLVAGNHLILAAGIAEPSHADEQLTKRLIAALKLVDIRVLDHIVVGDGNMVSFAERGLM